MKPSVRTGPNAPAGLSLGRRKDIRPLKRLDSVLRSFLERMRATEYYRVGRSPRYRAEQRRRTRAAARMPLLVVIGAYAFDIVASGSYGPIVVVLDVGVIGLALVGRWRLGRRGRHHPELVIWIAASGVTFSMAATAIAVPDLAIQSAGYLLVLPGLAALLLPWRTSTHVVWLVVFLVVAAGYFAFVPSYELTPDTQADLATVLAVASGASLAGKYILERVQMRNFAQMERIHSLRRQGDAYIAELTQTRGALQTSEATAQQLEQRALHDELTGLPNRALFWEHVSQRLARAGRRQAGFAVLFVDIDDFKTVNDTLGHAAGDHVLVKVASRLRDVLRTGDIAARMGGDEFVVLLDDVATNAAAAVAERVTEALRAPYEIGDGHCTATSSVGVAIGPADFQTADDVIAAADHAMYVAKQRGGGRYALHGA